MYFTIVVYCKVLEAILEMCAGIYESNESQSVEIDVPASNPYPIRWLPHFQGEAGKNYQDHHKEKKRVGGVQCSRKNIQPFIYTLVS